MLDFLLDAVADAGSTWLLLAAFGFAFGETALFLDLIIPGEVGLVVVGAAGERAGVPLALLVGFATVGAITGDSVSYLLGRHFGERLIRHWEPVERRLAPAVDAAKAYFARRGGSAIFFGRFVGALRAVVPFVAGMGGMSYGRFLPWNALASVAWTTLVVSLGFFLGRRIGPTVDRVAVVISIVVVAALVGLWWWRRRRPRADG